MATEAITVDNPYGIGALWAQGDFVAKGVMVLLVIMSAYSWFIIFTKWWEQRRLLRQSAEAEKHFWAADNLKTGVSKLSGKGNIFKVLAGGGLGHGLAGCRRGRRAGAGRAAGAGPPDRADQQRQGQTDRE